MALDRVREVGRGVQHLVDDVVARRDQADGNQTQSDGEPRAARDVQRRAGQSQGHAGQDEDLLDPVVRAGDGDVPTKGGTYRASNGLTRRMEVRDADGCCHGRRLRPGVDLIEEVPVVDHATFTHCGALSHARVLVRSRATRCITCPIVCPFSRCPYYFTSVPVDDPICHSPREDCAKVYLTYRVESGGSRTGWRRLRPAVPATESDRSQRRERCRLPATASGAVVGSPTAPATRRRPFRAVPGPSAGSAPTPGRA